MPSLESIDRNLPILIVDDLSAMRRIVRNCLKKLGFDNVIEAESAEQALAHLEKETFHFIITDWNLDPAHRNGHLPEIMQHEKLKNIPILFITAEAHRKAAAETVQDDAKVIVKPFTAEMLQRKMEAIFEYSASR